MMYERVNMVVVCQMGDCRFILLQEGKGKEGHKLPPTKKEKTV